MYRSPFQGSDRSATPHDQFLDQFEWDGGDWLYRYKETDAAYRVTDDEKDAVVAAFDRWQNRSRWIAALVLSGLLFLLIKTDALPLTATSCWLFGWLLSVGVGHVIDLIGFRAPTRALGQRAPVALAFSKPARAQFALDRTSPTELVGASFAAAGFLFLICVLGWPLNSLSVLPIAGFIWMAKRAIIQGVREQQARAADPITSPAT